MPKDPDRSHLADAIHFMDLINLADEELPAARATVERSKAAAAMARGELDKHLQWLGQHQELYSQAMKGCERRLKRQAIAYPRRRSLRAKLKDRIQEMDHSSELKFTQQLQERIQAMDRRGLR